MDSAKFRTLGAFGPGSVHGMGGDHRHNVGRRYRRGRRLHGSSRAVVAVVGTLLALLVFFALFGVFITQYVPLWMTDNEAQFTAQTQESFATLKSDVDLQAALGGPPSFGTPFVMSSQGIPLLAQPTAGTLNFNPKTPGIFANVSFSPGPGNSGRLYQNLSLGTIAMTLANRYYAPQQFSFEDDAVLQAQSPTQQIVAYPPSLNINVTGSQVGVTLSLVQLLGNSTQAISTGTQEIFTHYVHSQSYTANNSLRPVSATFLLGTSYACGWYTFFLQEFQKTGIGSHAVLPTTSPCSGTTSYLPSTLEVTFNNLASFTLVLSEFTVDIGVGVE